MKHILILLLAITLASCGTLKKTVHKQTTDSTSVVTKEDKSKITITETADTTVRIKGDTAKASKPLDNLVKGDTLRASTNGTSVEVFYNPKTGDIHAKAVTEPKELPVLFERKTQIDNDKYEEEEAAFHMAEVEKNIDRKETSVFKYILWILVMISVLVLLYFLYKFVP